MTSTDDTAPDVVARYFEMWNTGNSSTALEILSPVWVDHAHPEVNGPEGVRQAVGTIRAAQPGLQFRIEDILSGGDLIAAIGRVGTGPDDSRPGTRLIWLIRMDQGRMAEMWTYRDTSPPPSTAPPRA
jgi:ketosteroid isomerase-like protein